MKPNETNFAEYSYNNSTLSKNENENETAEILLQNSLFSFDERNWIKTENIFTSTFEVLEVIDSPSVSYITLHQPLISDIPQYDKTFDTTSPLAFIIIAKYENGKYFFVSSEMVNWEKLTIAHTFEKGVYHIFAKSYWNFVIDYNLVISSYSDNINEIKELKYEEIPGHWLSQILSNMGQRTGNRQYPCTNEADSFTSNIMFDNNNFSGFFVFYYENASKEGTMNINLYFKNLKGFKIMNLKQLLGIQGSEFTEKNKENNNKIFDEDFGSCNLLIKISKLSSVVVILQITDLPWLSSIDWYHDIWFEYPVEIMINRVRKENNSDRIEMDPLGLYLYEIEHERGIIVLIENMSSKDFFVKFDITYLKNLELKSSEEFKLFNEGKSLEFIVKAKGINILHFGIIKSLKENNHKLRYIYNIERLK